MTFFSDPNLEQKITKRNEKALLNKYAQYLYQETVNHKIIKNLQKKYTNIGMKLNIDKEVVESNLHEAIMATVLISKKWGKFIPAQGVGTVITRYAQINLRSIAGQRTNKREDDRPYKTIYLDASRENKYEENKIQALLEEALTTTSDGTSNPEKELELKESRQAFEKFLQAYQNKKNAVYSINQRTKRCNLLAYYQARLQGYSLAEVKELLGKDTTEHDVKALDAEFKNLAQRWYKKNHYQEVA